ncbi:iron-sulfur cluster assembly accessory protein [Alkalinema sp. FACHB-956]|uniref:HesB/IscA family protein n=1 Tax=Alkalinema sp. FACHB-956 TaxID=2692768 RepID=UPI001682733D|nr:iron-sulfur cluster assembly accessory protein [Alkalinema sp. FACHB-956]MBD2327931.1 iron-sulfur cluster assembly accessory protein [Alkalinema sp. FACHB-956]
MLVNMTEIAELRLRAFVQSANAVPDAPLKRVRLSIQDGGCSGYQYGLDIAPPQPDDIVVEQGKLQIYLDRQSASLLDGVVIDYVEGLTQSGFKFSNPNATETCGCGQSFKAGDCSPAGVSCQS